MRNDLLKSIFRRFISLKVFLEIYFNFLFRNNKEERKIPKLYYAGASSGDIGGPFVKIKKLKKLFPESIFKFNIIYVLSNSPNISLSTLNLIREKKISLVLNQNGVFYPAWYSGDWKKQNLKMSKIYHAADYVLWQSDFCKKASEQFLGKRLGNGEILYNSVDTKIFSPKTTINKRNFNLLITGNIKKQNNYRIKIVLESLKDIIKINRYVHLYIAGYIEETDYFLAEIERLKIVDFVSFLGHYSQENAVRIYQMADAYITMSYQDNCPSAVIEAMSCGLPILYSSSGGIPELVGLESGVGLEVPLDWTKIHIPKKELIVEGFFKIYEKEKIMSESARERAVKLFDMKDWTRKHMEILKNNLS